MIYRILFITSEKEKEYQSDEKSFPRQMNAGRPLEKNKRIERLHNP